MTLKTLAKVVTMLIRLLWLFELALGVYVATGRGFAEVKLHVGIGFATTLLIFLLAMIAAVYRAWVPAVLGLVFSALLPYIGLAQLPVQLGGGMRPIQYAHVIIALGAIGVAEMTYGKIKRLG